MYNQFQSDIYMLNSIPLRGIWGSELIKRYRWIRYVGFGGYVRYFGGYSFVNDIVIGLSESSTARDIGKFTKSRICLSNMA